MITAKLESAKKYEVNIFCYYRGRSHIFYHQDDLNNAKKIPEINKKWSEFKTPM